MSEEEGVDCPFCDPKTHKISKKLWEAILKVYRRVDETPKEVREVE